MFLAFFLGFMTWKIRNSQEQKPDYCVAPQLQFLKDDTRNLKQEAIYFLKEESI